MMILNRLLEIVGIKNATDVRINPSTEETSLAIQVASEKIDNQEDAVLYVTLVKSTSDGDAIASHGVNKALLIHHIYVINAESSGLTANKSETTVITEKKKKLNAKQGGC